MSLVGRASTERYADFPALGRRVSRIGLGSANFSEDSSDKAFAALDRYVELGGNFVDTAHVYGFGASERLIGRWLGRSAARRDVVLITKCAHPDAQWQSRLDPGSIASDVAESLGRLKTDHVDILMVHRDDPDVPVGEVVDALSCEVTAGRALSIGASNWTPQRLGAALAYAKSNDLPSFTSSSPYCGLAEWASPPLPGCVSATAAEDVGWYERSELQVICWSAQSGGYFEADSERAQATHFDVPTNVERRARVAELSRRTGLAPSQIALAWVLHQPFRPFALVGARSVEHLVAAWEVLDVSLDAAELKWFGATGQRSERGEHDART